MSEPDGTVGRFCAECGHPIPEEYDQPERKGCPECGSTRREHHAEAHLSAEFRAAVRAEVRRGLEPLRLAVLGIVVSIGLSIGLSVGFGIPSVWYGLLAGFASFGLACFLLWNHVTRHYLMEFADRLIR